MIGIKHRKLTAAGWQRIEEIADLRMKIPTYKELADEVGLAPLYVAQLVSQIMRDRQCGSNRGTHKFVLADGEIEQIASSATQLSDM